MPDQAAQLPSMTVESEAALRRIYPPPHDLIRRKQLARLDRHCRKFVSLSPLICISTAAPDGTCDVSPRGDGPGFVKVLDDIHLLIPDRRGNNRIDALRNIIANPHIGILFVIPGIDDLLRVNGAAAVVTDPAFLAEMSMDGRPPAVAILVTVKEAFLHCGRAFKRAHVWDPKYFQPVDALPPLAQMLADQTDPDREEQALLADSAKAPLY
jgi:PPOX class probable FMN-dependent enzyme